MMKLIEGDSGADGIAADDAITVGGAVGV